MAGESDRSISERTWAAQAAQGLPPAQRALWNECKVAHRVALYLNRIFVIWKANADGTPCPINSLHVTGVNVTFARGVEIEMRDASHRLLVVPQHPVQVFDHDLFMWSPFFNDVCWVPHPHANGQHVLRLSIVMRMRSHPDYWEAGHTYITDVAAFRSKWPQFTGQKF